MSTATPTLPESDAPRPLNEAQRMTNVFIAPSTTFTDIRRNAMWLAPWLLLAVVSLCYTTVVGKKIGFEQVAQNNMRMAPASQTARIEALPPDQRAAAERRGVTVTKYIGYGYSLLSLIFLAIVALILWGTFNFVVGTELRFGQSLAIVMYASLPGLIKILLAMVAILAGMDAENFNIQNPIGSNPGYFLSFSDTPRFLFSLASAVDVFTIWTLVLTAIGFAVVGKAKRGTAMSIVFGWWAVFILCSAGIAAAFS